MGQQCNNLNIYFKYRPARMPEFMQYIYAHKRHGNGIVAVEQPVAQAAPAQIPACGITAPGSSKTLTSAIRSIQVQA